MCLEEKLAKLKALHTSNFVFWVLAKFLCGMGIGILLPTYFFGYGWVIVGWMLIAFAVILSIPAMHVMLSRKRKK